MAVASFAGTWPKLATDDTATAARAAALAATATRAATTAAHAARAATRAAALAALAATTRAATRAATTAAHAARAATTTVTDVVTIWGETSSDVTSLQMGLDAGIDPLDLVFELATAPLWQGEWPEELSSAWHVLANGLLARNEDWVVWTEWYEARLKGGPSNVGLERARILIADEDWDQGPEHVNAIIKRLIEEHIPVNQPASVMPEWRNGALYQAAPPASVDIEQQIALARLHSVANTMRHLAGDLEGESNVDRRVARYLEGIADRFPEDFPTVDKLFDLWHQQSALGSYENSIHDEWPDLLSIRLQSLCAEFSIALLHFGDLRTAESDITNKEAEGADPAILRAIAKEMTAVLQYQPAAEIVDKSVPERLAAIGGKSSDTGENFKVTSSQEMETRMTADQAASLSNILRGLVTGSSESDIARELVNHGNMAYVDAFQSNYVQAAREVGKEDAKRAARAVTRSSLGAAAGKTLWERAKEAMPETFRWWRGNLKSNLDDPVINLERGIAGENIPTKNRIDWAPDLTIFRELDEPWCPEMVVIPTGRFLMGSADSDDEAYNDEKPQHEIKIGERFAMGRYPVTFEEYDAFCRSDGRELPDDAGWGRGRRPAINVSWNDAQDYIAWLNEQVSGGARNSYRLPSEAEWEYACRAGTVTRYPWGDEWDGKVANGNEEIGKTTEVGTYPANIWGLLDMMGNVREWCADTWRRDYDGAPTDGSAWLNENIAARVIRGGSWYDDTRYVRSAYRNRNGPADRNGNLGFRCARGL